jgi:prepilin-type N-terminal cleavage/methylation domain-containing protein/prepilin-type processing-associated H-X9-DG protein
MKNRRGFTLIELLVVIAIIAVLAAILFPVFARAKAAAKQATCTQNLNSIGKAVRMYASDNDDMLPTNVQAANGTLAVQCQLATVDFSKNDPVTKVPPLVTKNSSPNYVEGLQLYIEKLQDTKGNESIWRCPAASDATFPALNATKNGPPLALTAAVTYVLSYYAAGQTEGRVDDPSNTLLMREVDRKCNALLRPYPKTATAAFGKPDNPPYNPFPTTDHTGTLYPFQTPTNMPLRHSNGFIVLFIDGHVAYRTAAQVAPVAGSTTAAFGTTNDPITGRWYAGPDPANPARVWITL